MYSDFFNCTTINFARQCSVQNLREQIVKFFQITTGWDKTHLNPTYLYAMLYTKSYNLTYYMTSLNFLFSFLDFFYTVSGIYCSSTLCDCTCMVLGIWVVIIYDLYMPLLLPQEELFLFPHSLCTLLDPSRAIHSCLHVIFLFKLIMSLNHRKLVRVGLWLTQRGLVESVNITKFYYFLMLLAVFQLDSSLTS